MFHLRSLLILLAQLICTISSARMQSPYNTVLYATGLWNAPTDPSVVEEIKKSGFDTIAMWCIHVDPNTADISYGFNQYKYIVVNGQLNPLYGNNCENCTNIGEYIHKLKYDTDSSVKHVLFTIGYGYPDYANIVKVLNNATLKEKMFINFGVLINELGVDGFDYDNEEFTGSVTRDEPIINAIVEMVETFSKINESVTTQTFCPYNSINSWTQTLKNIYKDEGKQLVSWWNVQCYSGGAANANNLKSEWINNIERNANEIGVNNASTFIVPGFAASDGINGVENDFKRHAKGVVDGGFIWNYPDTESKDNGDLSQFNQAIINGLD